MNWFKALVFKLCKGLIEQLVAEVLEKVVVELNEEIDARFVDDEKRRTLKSGIMRLRSRAMLEIRERL